MIFKFWNETKNSWEILGNIDRISYNGNSFVARKDENNRIFLKTIVETEDGIVLNDCVLPETEIAISENRPDGYFEKPHLIKFFDIYEKTKESYILKTIIVIPYESQAYLCEDNGNVIESY